MLGRVPGQEDEYIQSPNTARIRPIARERNPGVVLSLFLFLRVKSEKRGPRASAWKNLNFNGFREKVGERERG